MTWLWIAASVFGADIKERCPEWSYANVTAVAPFWPYWVALRLLALLRH